MLFNEPRNGRDIAKAPPQHGGFREPFFHLIAQNIFSEQPFHPGRFKGGPDRQHIIRAHITKRPHAKPFHALGYQKPKCLMRKPTFKRIGHQKPTPTAREGFNQQAIGWRQFAPQLLQPEPFLHRFRQMRPARRIMQNGAHACGKPGGQRHAAAGINRHAGFISTAGADNHRCRIKSFITHHLARKQKTITGREGGDEPFLHLTQSAAATKPHLDHGRFNDGAQIHAQLPRHARIANMQQAFGIAE